MGLINSFAGFIILHQFFSMYEGQTYEQVLKAFEGTHCIGTIQSHRRIKNINL